MSTISSSTTSTTAYKITADTTGTLVLQTGASPTTAMMIDTSQNVGIGTSSPSQKLDVNGDIQQRNGGGVTIGKVENASGWYSVTGDSANVNGTQMSHGSTLRFLTAGSERARIDSSGNLLVGVTSGFVAPSGGSAQFVNGSTSQVFVRNSSATSGKYFQMGVNSSNAFIVYNNSNTGMFLTDGSTAWAANSDERVKTTLVPFANAVAKVSTLRAGTGRYLTDDESVSRSFLIAQDVQAVLPEAIDVQDDEQGTLGLRYQDLIPLLTAAIQELKAELDAAKADIATLKGAA